MTRSVSDEEVTALGELEDAARRVAASYRSKAPDQGAWSQAADDFHLLWESKLRLALIHPPVAQTAEFLKLALTTSARASGHLPDWASVVEAASSLTLQEAHRAREGLSQPLNPSLAAHLIVATRLLFETEEARFEDVRLHLEAAAKEPFTTRLLRGARFKSA